MSFEAVSTDTKRIFLRRESQTRLFALLPGLIASQYTIYAVPDAGVYAGFAVQVHSNAVLDLKSNPGPKGEFGRVTCHPVF